MGEFAVGVILGIVSGFGAERYLRAASRAVRILTPSLVFAIPFILGIALSQAGQLPAETAALIAGFGFFFAVGFTWAWARANAGGLEPRRGPSEPTR